MTVRGYKKWMSWLTILAFSFGGITSAFAGSRILPTGHVKVFEGQRLVQVLSQESAFPNGALLTTQGKCGVRLDSLYLVAEDGSTFGVLEKSGRKDLRVDSGVIYFAFARNIGKLAFLTPAGELSAEQIRLDAATDGGSLKGYLDVSSSQVQLGVLSGGSILVSTAEGQKLVRSGRQLTLAFVDLLPEEEKKKAEKDTDKKNKDTETVQEASKKIPKAYFIAGGVLLTGALLGLAGGGGSGGGSPGPTSPITPTLNSRE